MEEPSKHEDSSEPPCKKSKIDSISSSLSDEEITTVNSKISENSEEDNLPTNSDPFSKHMEYVLSEQDKDNSEKWNYETKGITCPEIATYVYLKPILQNVSCKEPSMEKNDVTEFHLKKNLLDSISTSFSSRKFSKSQIVFLNQISDYFDVLHMKRTHGSGENLRYLYTLHVLNHILKSRAKIIHHNSKLSKNPDEEYRDQGFTRAISVILVPFRHDCYRIISHLTSFLPECVVMNKKRFEMEYGPPPARTGRIKKKPQSYYEIFEGNTDEDFKIGVRIKNKSLRLYSDFYFSDLIIASPLGLRQIIGAEGDKDRDFDFLSSVEVLVLDRADVLMLQNIVNVLHILKHFNLMPKEAHGCNLFRVRMSTVEGMSKFFRQTILLSSAEHAFFNTHFFRSNTYNYSGILALGTGYVSSPVIEHILIPVTMYFRWFDTGTLLDSVDDRFNFFINKVLPEYKDKSMSQTMIYIPSYFSYVRLRNYFRESELSCVMICEYSTKGKVAQARDVFYKGHRHFMLYTERAHFYNRFSIKGIQHIVFYQLPMYPEFFREICHSLMDSHPRRKEDERSVCVVTSKHDITQLKYIVGLQETKEMLNSKQKTFVKFTEDKLLLC